MCDCVMCDQEVKTPVQAYVCFLKEKKNPSKLSTKSRPCDKEKQEILTFQRLDPFSVLLFFHPHQAWRSLLSRLYANLVALLSHLQ